MWIISEVCYVFWIEWVRADLKQPKWFNEATIGRLSQELWCVLCDLRMNSTKLDLLILLYPFVDNEKVINFFRPHWNRLTGLPKRAFCHVLPGFPKSWTWTFESWSPTLALASWNAWSRQLGFLQAWIILPPLGMVVQQLEKTTLKLWDTNSTDDLLLNCDGCRTSSDLFGIAAYLVPSAYPVCHSKPTLAIPIQLSFWENRIIRPSTQPRLENRPLCTVKFWTLCKVTKP